VHTRFRFFHFHGAKRYPFNLPICSTTTKGLLEDESRGRDDMREAASRAERRANDLAVQLDESRLALDQADRAKKVVSLLR